MISKYYVILMCLTFRPILRRGKYTAPLSPCTFDDRRGSLVCHHLGLCASNGSKWEPAFEC